MARFAYFSPYVGWESDFPTGAICTFDEHESVQLDCERISDHEVNLIRARVRLECPICNFKMLYNKGFTRSEARKGPKNKSPYFYHQNDATCHESESLAHALTKKYLFQKLAESGYSVKEEHRLKVNGKRARADVAAFINAEGKNELRLVVEVQASNIYPAILAKRVNVYRAEGVPTAWVLLLDDFFESYTGTTKDVIDLERNTTERVPISSGEENIFVVSGKDSKAFMMIMNEYGYVLGVNHSGNVFLIRRDPMNEDARITAIMRGTPWSPQDEIYKITRIADKDIVPTLELTPLLHLYEYENPDLGRKGQFVSGSAGTEPHYSDDWGHDYGDDQIPIDFDGGKLDGDEANKALNPVLLIKEIWIAQRLARLNFENMEREAEARRRAEEERALKIESQRQAELERIRIAEEERQRQIEQQRNAEMERTRIEKEEQERQIQYEADESARKREELERQRGLQEQMLKASYTQEKDWSGVTKPTPAPPVYRELQKIYPRRTYINDGLVREIEKLYIVNAYKPVNKIDILSLTKEEGEQLLKHLEGQPQIKSPIRLIRNEMTILESLNKLDKTDRQKLERNVFPNGLPQWYVTERYKLDYNETLKQNKFQNVQRSNIDQKLAENQQMRFDF